MGNLSLGVKLADDSDIQIVRYEIKLDGEPLRNGSVPVSEDRTASVTEGNLEATDGYQVKLTADRNAIMPCKGQAEFTVVEGRMIMVPVTFQCEDTGPDQPAP